MRIESLRIQNLRAFKDETIYFNQCTVLVGPNGAGKSTVLCALNIFFRETQGSPNNLLNLSVEDFHNKQTDQPIRITVTFADLTSTEQAALSHYFRNGKLMVTSEAHWNPETNSAEVKQYGERQTFPKFENIFKLFSQDAPAKEIKDEFLRLSDSVGSLGKATSKPQILQALIDYQNAHPDECKPCPSSDEFYGFRGSGKLSPFIQWIFVPALKDASTEHIEAKQTALGKLLARTVRAKISFDKETESLRVRTQAEYAKLLEQNQGALNAISQNLEKRLQEWAHPEASLKLSWRNDPKTSVVLADPLAEIIAGEGESFKGSLTRFGHGLQRCYLLALLQELAAIDDSNSPKLVLGCEEPELFQHPPQARHLSSVLVRLSEQNSQIVICTHSPHFVSGKNFENVRLIRKDPQTKASKCSSASFEHIEQEVSSARDEKVTAKEQGMLLKINESLQIEINEMFFTPVLILVEGREDRAFITSYLHLMNRWNDFRRLGCHIVSSNRKSNLVRPICIARKLSIPTFVVFDADSDCKEVNLPQHEQDNRAILTLCGYTSENPMPKDTLWKSDLVMWSKQIDSAVFEEFPAESVVQTKDACRKSFGDVGGINKDELFISELLVEAWKKGMKSKVLIKLCESILAFASAQSKILKEPPDITVG